MSFDEIIAKVKAHPELWQSSHPFYRQRVVSARTWKEIAAELKADDWNLVKKRWKHLKDQFRKEVKKLASNKVPFSSWLHYNELQFLTDEILKKPETKQESAESESDSETEGRPLKRRKSKYDVGTSNGDSKKHTSIKYKKIMRSLTSLADFIDRSANMSNSDEHLKNDTDYMFLLSLLPTMRNLSDIQRLHFRGKINHWLLNALVENEYSEECDTKAFVQAQINDAKQSTG
ncbi:uncharacterized protein [Epargyreus clarus]|uniref:uncharacterized protein n=1 Tax=Epargyreus clarus TaxID=520877 RepID=UPI003C2FA98D